MIGGIAQVKIVLISRGKFPDSSGFQPERPLYSAGHRSFSIDAGKSAASFSWPTLCAALFRIGRIRPIVTAYRDHGLEARDTKSVA